MIEKSLIIDILKNNNLTQEKVMHFISEYVYLMKNKWPTHEELTKILLLVQTGSFNLMYAADIAALTLKYNLSKLYNPQGKLINIYID